jgi:hypothetical protein
MAGIGDAPCRSVIAEDARDLQRGTGQQRRGLCGRPHRRDELLERAGDLAERDTGVKRGRIELLVAEQTRAIMLPSMSLKLKALLSGIRC